MQLRYTVAVSAFHGHNSCDINGHVHIKYHCRAGNSSIFWITVAPFRFIAV